MLEKTIFDPSALVKWIKDKKAVFAKSLISYQRITVNCGKDTQSSSEHQVKFSKLLLALFFCHPVRDSPYIIETARKGWAVLSIFRVGVLIFSAC